LQNFIYDANGNLIRDNYRNVNITNNQYNLPEVIDFGNNNRINYFYNSTGEKMLRAVSVAGATPIMTYYFGPFIHEGTQAGTSSLKYILTTEGRILNVGTDLAPIWKWEYDLKDHLGNVRVVVSPHATPGYATLLQENNYYPFGMRMSEISTNSGTCTNQYKYNGKELQTDFGLNWYDYGARFYDPALGRWHSVDPMMESYYSQSPYHFSGNNPIKFVDLNGMNYNPIYDEETSVFLGTDDKGLQGDAIIMNKKDFTQGMAHDDAMKVGNTLDNMSFDDALAFANNGKFGNFLNHFNSLSGRPDYDGEMSYSELLDWGRKNGNSPVFLDASKIDLGNISISDFPGVGEGRRINTVGKGTPLDTYGPWGKCYMELMSANGLVKLSSDEFDYRQHDLGKAWEEGIKTFLYERFVRYPAIDFLQKYHGIDDNFGFMMHPYGRAKLKK
jgi:RHS repeat-associated protein